MAEFDKTLFSVLGEKIDQPIGCANCHEANTMKLVVTNPALDEALQKQGKDWHTFTRQEMRSIVCANCYVEYYFSGEGKYLTFPWENGTPSKISPPITPPWHSKIGNIPNRVQV